MQTVKKEPDKKKPDFWQDHSLKYLEMAYRHDKNERIENPDGYGRRTGQCGDTIEMFIVLRNDRILTVAYTTDGCMNTNACANTVALLVENKTVNQAWRITPEKVAEYLETLPAGHFHCAELAVGALYLALANISELRQAPWKRLYGKQ